VTLRVLTGQRFVPFGNFTMAYDPEIDWTMPGVLLSYPFVDK
jgi:hypothetical protein